MAYRNYSREFANKNKRVNSAQFAGVPEGRFTKANFLEWRGWSMA